jgi:aminopeptidase N
MRRMPRRDPHSHHDTAQPQVHRLAWRARVDFDARVLDAEARLAIDPPDAAGPLDLDTRDLAIERVVDEQGEPLRFELGPPDPILGARLRVEVGAGAREVRVHYRTSPSASALGWLDPIQTHGRVHPFLYSQCQAIHARSIVPLPDTPRVRLRYDAALDVPRELRARMAAAHLGRDEAPDGRSDRAVERFQMEQPIPPYLIALAVGDLAARDLGPRSRVWAEPGVVERAAWEFAAVDDMLRTAEGLFGPYPWERFDLLVMPPSFPYGGMENPRLTFLTPTLLAGDRSLVNVVAHELAHSWTGNLVTNASAEHFWLNEGFTVWAERRILEALDGAEAAELHAAIGRRELERALARFASRPEMTLLRTRLEGVDPDEVFSVVPYEKGYLLLRALEEAAGRARWDAFMRRYLDTFRFRSITSEELAAFLEHELPDVVARVPLDHWLEAPGLPFGAPAARSERLDVIGRFGTAPPPEGTRLEPAEWQLLCESLPRPAPAELLRALDERFGLGASGNYEVLVAWLVLALESGYAPALPRAEAVLAEVGRMKYLRPLYTVLAKDPATRPLAARTFARLRASYHPIARQVIEGVLAAAAAT